MSIERLISQIGYRHWDEIRAGWLGAMAALHPTVPSAPSPGLDKLPTLQAAELRDRQNNPDLEGLRENAFAEAVFLHFKASHALLAVKRLSKDGMQSWALFNAYHSALLNAKATMGMLGVHFPKISGADSIIDVFPAPEKRRNNRQFKAKAAYESFLYMRLGAQLSQRHVWLALQRCCNQTLNAWPQMEVVGRIMALDWEGVTPPRNRFLYVPRYWPEIGDINEDIEVPDWSELFKDGLDPASAGFLLALCLDLHQLARWLFDDLSGQSNLLKSLLASARFPVTSEPVWEAEEIYRSIAA